MTEVEEKFYEKEKIYLEQLRTAQDEIAILRELTGTAEEGVKFRFASQEKELARARRETEETRGKLKAVTARNFELTQEQERLQTEVDALSREAAKLRSQGEWGLKSLEKEKKILENEVRTQENKLQTLTQDLDREVRTLQDRAERERKILEETWSKGTGELLSQQKWRSLEEDRILFQGLYAYLQNHLAGILGSSQMILERLSSFKPEPKPPGLARRIFALPGRAALFGKSIDKVIQETNYLEEKLSGNVETLKKVQKGVKDFSLFIRFQEFKPEKIHLNEVAEEVLSSLDSLLKEGKTSVIRNWTEIPEILADREMVRSALTELLTNAVEAQPVPGEIVVSLQADPEARTSIFSVRDRGPGVPAHLREKIYQPFFTTKENHSGLGLTRALRWAGLNGGRVELRSESSGGEFVLSFPACQA